MPRARFEKSLPSISILVPHPEAGEACNPAVPAAAPGTRNKELQTSAPPTPSRVSPVESITVSGNHQLSRRRRIVPCNRAQSSSRSRKRSERKTSENQSIRRLRRIFVVVPRRARPGRRRIRTGLSTGRRDARAEPMERSAPPQAPDAASLPLAVNARRNRAAQWRPVGLLDGGKKWYSLGDSNPCFCRERAAS